MMKKALFLAVLLILVVCAQSYAGLYSSGFTAGDNSGSVTGDLDTSSGFGPVTALDGATTLFETENAISPSMEWSVNPTGSPTVNVIPHHVAPNDLPPSTPEPAALFLYGAGLLGLAAYRKMSKKA